MMSSQHGFILIKSGSINIINKIRQYREETGRFITFTLDAGPNVHVLYHAGDEVEIKEFIRSNLQEYTEDGKIIWDEAGKGPEKIS